MSVKDFGERLPLQALENPVPQSPFRLNEKRCLAHPEFCAPRLYARRNFQALSMRVWLDMRLDFTPHACTTIARFNAHFKCRHLGRVLEVLRPSASDGSRSLAETEHSALVNPAGVCKLVCVFLGVEPIHQENPPSAFGTNFTQLLKVLDNLWNLFRIVIMAKFFSA
ncbi:hypothetical protein B0H19DRAFT_1084000 [Mycena capillaripes]|nr:hypothetical protein B0H19DRAFT_1084000 [Mycena capillaripes]